MSRRVLVTGVSGFVGGALGAFLRRQGDRVSGVSRSGPRARAVDAFTAHDLSRPLPVDLGDSGPFDAIVHCAALSVPWAAPEAFAAHNVGATANLLDFARRRGCGRFVFISSSSVYYRHGDQLGITEDTPFPRPPINHYAATKRRCEELVLGSGLEVLVLRPRAVFGPGDTVLFPRILRAARRGMLPRITRRDGVSPRGDLIGIDNLVHFVGRALDWSATGCFNLTNGAPVDLYGFLEEIFERLGYPPLRRRLPVAVAFSVARAAELISRWFFRYREPPITRFGVEVMAYSKTFDVAKATAAFGPAPVSNDEGVDRFVAWQRAQPAPQ